MKIEKHSTTDKRVSVTTYHLQLFADFDDVNHAEVDAALLHLKEIVEKNWDEEKYKKLYKQQVIKV